MQRLQKCNQRGYLCRRQRLAVGRHVAAALRDLAACHNLPQLSMGTSQDYVVALQEGATIVRLGSILFARAP